MPKAKTLDQIQAMKDKAVRFLEEVVGDPDRADEFSAMTPKEYAEHKGIEIRNPFGLRSRRNRRAAMPRPTYTDLKERVAELEEENQVLSDKLDSILDIASEDEDEDEDDEEDDEVKDDKEDGCDRRDRDDAYRGAA